MKITVNTQNIEKVMSKLELTPKQIVQASKHTTNRVINMTKTDIKRKAREKYTAKAGELTKSIKTIKSGMGGIIVSSGSPLPLTAFKMNPAKATKTKKQLRAEVKRGSRKPVKRGFLTSKGPYQRTGLRRYPIKPVYSLSHPQMLGEDSILESIEKNAEENLEKRLKHEIERILK